MRETTRLICKAVISGAMPEKALSWDSLEIVNTSPIVGSGESATWKHMVTIRRNGKQIYRGHASMFHNSGDGISLLTGSILVGQSRNAKLYVIPQSL